MFATLRQRNFALLWLGGVISIGPSTGARSLLQAKSPDAYRGRIFGAFGMTAGLFALIGTVTAGFLTGHLDVVTVLNIQALGYELGGLLIIALLPREKDTPPLQAEPVLAGHALAQPSPGDH
jgi:MFS family permease